MRGGAPASPAPAPEIPLALRVYGALGLTPFWAPPLVGLGLPSLIPLAGLALSAYAAVILSFLAGTRLGMSVMGQRPSTLTLSLSMIPPLVGWALMLAPPEFSRLRLGGLALALLAHAIWDSRAGDAPAWYGRLRWPLTLGAVIGLIAGAAVLHG
jgi:hypothetical protein